MRSDTALLVGVLALAFAAMAVLLALFAARLSAARERARLAGEQAAAERSAASQVREEHEFLLRFLADFPYLTRDLRSTTKPREIPGLLLDAVVRTFEPDAACVLLQRQRSPSDPGREERVVVAAATRSAGLATGAELAGPHPEIAAALASRRVFSRAELLAKAPAAAADGRPGLGFDLLAPMLIGEETLGLIGLSRPGHASGAVRAALRFLGQTGAQAVHDAAAYSQMKATADLDGLTGIYNKRQMTRLLAEALADAQQRMVPLSLFLFDLDHFKNYNDVNGHVAGDRLLRALAQLVRDNVRKADVFGRVGGEEFLLLLPETPLGPALAVAEKLRAEIAAHGFAFRDKQPLGVVSVSGGVAEYPADGLDGTRLLAAADQALYLAKRHGRNRVLAAERRYMVEEETAVVEALEDGEHTGV